jgi:hypothetical protein
MPSLDQPREIIALNLPPQATAISRQRAQLMQDQQFPEVRVWYNHNKVLVKHSRFIGSR